MGSRLPYVSSKAIATGPAEKVFDTLSELAPLVHCPECGSNLLHMNTTFFSERGKTWTLPLPVCPCCDPPHISPKFADITVLRQKRNVRIRVNQSLYSSLSLSKALPSPSISGGTWEQLYQDAIREFDPTKLQGRIADARHAILDRAEEILTLPPCAEQRALNSAFKTLRVLEEVAVRERTAA
jgi:hypothetical protein